MGPYGKPLREGRDDRHSSERHSSERRSSEPRGPERHRSDRRFIEKSGRDTHDRERETDRRSAPIERLPVVRTAADGSDLTPRATAIHLLQCWDLHKRDTMESLLGQVLDETHLSPSDRGFLTELCYGAVRHRNTLRVLSEQFLSRRLTDTHRSVRAALAIGLYQTAYLDTPPHAVVDATIEAWRSLDPMPGPQAAQVGAVGLLNAVLRRACEAIEHLPAGTEPEDPRAVIRAGDHWVRVEGLALSESVRAERLGIQYSHPPELVRLWSERYDDETLTRILGRDNETPPLFLAVRRDETVDHFVRLLRVAGLEAVAVGDPELPTVRLLTPSPIPRIPGFASGDFWVQDLTARRLSNLMPEREGVSLLDLCAAPGGKLATLLDRGGIAEAVACDISDDKLRRVAENLTRLRLGDGKAPGGAKVGLVDVPNEPERLRFDRHFDQILVDAPCSNTGVLNRRHEARWRFLPEEVRSLNRVQHGLLQAAARHLAPGGDLLYTTCSLEPSENSGAVHDLLARHTELRLVEEVEILPGDHDGDGGYGALLHRPRGG